MEDQHSASFWIAIIGAISVGVTTLAMQVLNAILAYKAQQQALINAHMLDFNTRVTQQAAKENKVAATENKAAIIEAKETAQVAAKTSETTQKIVESTHHLVNGGTETLLEKFAAMANELASVRKRHEDYVIAADAEKALDEHRKRLAGNGQSDSCNPENQTK